MCKGVLDKVRKEARKAKELRCQSALRVLRHRSLAVGTSYIVSHRPIGC